MIKKYNDFLNEKLSDKLKGFSEEEILDNIKKIPTKDILIKSVKLNFFKIN